MKTNIQLKHSKYLNFKEFNYPLKYQLIIPQQISNAVTNLFNQFKSLDKNSFIIIIFRVKVDNNEYRNISSYQIVRLYQINNLINIFITFWNKKVKIIYL